MGSGWLCSYDTPDMLYTCLSQLGMFGDEEDRLA